MAGKRQRAHLTALLKYDAACRAVAEAKTFDEVREWENKAAAIQEYSRRARDRSMELDCLEIREHARRRRGQLLLEFKAAGELEQGDHEVTSRGPRVMTLESLGIAKNESARDQKIAKLPQDAFERLVARCRAYAEMHPKKHTFDMLNAEQREAKEARRRAQFNERIRTGGTIDDLHKLIRDGYKFSTILADPPWHFVTRSEAGEGRSASQHYVTDRNQAEQIKTLPVRELAAPDCTLFLWMVDWAPKLALDVIEAWGFAHKTTAFTWAKQNASGDGWFMGNGYWTRANPEDCWLATRGKPKRLNADVRQLIVAPVMEHSRKPDEIHDRIERLVAGPYLELFARRECPNWVTWGNELAFKPPLPPHDPETGEIIESAAEVVAAVPEPAVAAPSGDPQSAGSPPSDDQLDIPAFLDRNNPACIFRSPLA